MKTQRMAVGRLTGNPLSRRTRLAPGFGRRLRSRPLRGHGSRSRLGGRFVGRHGVLGGGVILRAASDELDRMADDAELRALLAGGLVVPPILSEVSRDERGASLFQVLG